MKKLKLTGKLSLNKETISKLNDEQMNDVNGGRGSGSDRLCSNIPCATTGCPSIGIVCEPITPRISS
ncbi:class I lanthipeptide [bacterium SCSIO 12643]|nr:class I lanthipeptide [bacterium SCSIO 12643]